MMNSTLIKLQLVEKYSSINSLSPTLSTSVMHISVLSKKKKWSRYYDVLRLYVRNGVSS